MAWLKQKLLEMKKASILNLANKKKNNNGWLLDKSMVYWSESIEEEKQLIYWAWKHFLYVSHKNKEKSLYLSVLGERVKLSPSKMVGLTPSPPWHDGSSEPAFILPSLQSYPWWSGMHWPVQLVILHGNKHISLGNSNFSSLGRDPEKFL